MAVDALSIPNCAKGTAEVTASSLRVRAGPGVTHEQAGRMLLQGELVTVWAAGGEWWIVQAADGTTGWSSAAYLRAVGELVA